MDALDHVGAGQHEDVVVALEVAAVITETLAAEVGLLEPVALDHGAHRAVEDEDALGEEPFEAGLEIVRGHGFGAAGPRRARRRGGL